MKGSLVHHGYTIDEVNVRNLCFADIECVVEKPYVELESGRQTAWGRRANRIRAMKKEKSHLSDEELYEAEAGLYDEFSRVICVGLGRVKLVGDKLVHSVTCIENPDEKLLLEELSEYLPEYPNSQFRFCGYNIHNFDMPFLRNRFHVNGLQIPLAIQKANGKPWSSINFDIMMYWQGESTRQYIGLDDLCLLLNVPSPKDLCNNKDVQQMWRDGKIKEIVAYCCKDVISNINLIFRLLAWELPPAEGE